MMVSRRSDAESPPRSSGLTSVEATRRLAQHGPNEQAPTRRLSALMEIGRLFANPLVLILLVASAMSAWPTIPRLSTGSHGDVPRTGGYGEGAFGGAQSALGSQRSEDTARRPTLRRATGLEIVGNSAG